MRFFLNIFIIVILIFSAVSASEGDGGYAGAFLRMYPHGYGS